MAWLCAELPGTHTMQVCDVFRRHGYLCASHPWEVIIGTLLLTTTLFSMSVFTGSESDRLCGWNYVCQSQQEINSSDVMILSITRCLAVIYIYLQFRSLRKLGSKYLLGIAGLFTMFSSFVFSSALVHLLEKDLTGLNEALPFFLLLVDLSKASTLARFALSSLSQDDVKKNIAQGMAVLGPVMTLDALVVTLVIGVGTLSGLKQLEVMCCFGCLSVLANYVAFMTFYPACLSLVLQMSRDQNGTKPIWYLPRKIAKMIQEEEKQPNPVTQRVKIIMSAGLVYVHAHSRWLANDKSTDLSSRLVALTQPTEGSVVHKIEPSIIIGQFYIERFLRLNTDYAITLILAAILAFKYVFFDKDIDKQLAKVPVEPQVEVAANKPAITTVPCQDSFDSVDSIDSVDSLVGLATTECHHQDLDKLAEKFYIQETSPHFTVGEDPSDDETEDNENNQGGRSELEPSHHAPDHLEQEQNTCSSPPRPIHVCLNILKSDEGPSFLTNDEIVSLVKAKHIPAYKLESCLADCNRAVHIRRQLVSEKLQNTSAMSQLPCNNYDYSFVDGSCCENVIGYVPVPVGSVGPLLLDNKHYTVPMATTEGCLVASTNRGCRALSMCGGVRSTIVNDGMSRGPVVRFPDSLKAGQANLWLQKAENFLKLQQAFDSTSRFCRLKKIKTAQAGRLLYIRLIALTGDAMGMNMLSKGSEKALGILQQEFPQVEILSLSGNYCTDKKPAALNWLDGRGKSVICEATLDSHVIETVLKTTVPALVDLNVSKNLIGSAMAGSIGGFNAHAANVVSAIYIATGQDPAQVVTSANCITLMEASGNHGNDLTISCSMPSIEIGTIGGGTVLPAQSACLKMMDVGGSSKDEPGDNSSQLARIVCATVLAGELSLMSALAAGHLVRSHLKHNRSSISIASSMGLLQQDQIPAGSTKTTALGSAPKVCHRKTASASGTAVTN